MKAGPKASVSALPLRLHDLPASGGSRVVRFVERYVKMPKGAGARKPMRVRPWQADLIAGVFDNPRPRLALWSLPRGNGKSSLAAALGLYGLHGDGVEGASVVVVAADERQASIVFRTAARMTELSEQLLKRTQVYQDRLYIPRTGSTFQVLPAEARRLEGLDPSLAIIDEIGVVDRRVYEVVALASGKRDYSLVLCIGTPSPDRETSVMWDLRTHGLTASDPSFRFVEYSAPEGHPVDCEHCWEVANPGLDDLIHRDALTALLPPKTREGTYRRVRLGQWVEEIAEPWIAAEQWNRCAAPDRSPLADGADVVLGFDGSFSGDTTALVAVTIDDKPHVEVLELWEPASTFDNRIPIADVEAAIRDACRRYPVREIVADPFRWARTLQLLDGEGLPVAEFPQTPQRMTPATTRFYEAVVNKTLSHSGDPRLARHIHNAIVRTDSRGTRLQKEHKNSTRRIDLAVAAVMAHARASELASMRELQVY